MIYLLAEQLTFCLFLPRPPIVRTAVRGKEIAAHKHRVHTASVRRERKRAGGEGCCTVLTWNRCCSLAIVLLCAVTPSSSPRRGGSTLDSRRAGNEQVEARGREEKTGEGKNDNDPRPVLNKALCRIHFMRNCSNVG